MASNFRVEQLPDALGKQAEIVLAGDGAGEVKAARDKLALFAIHHYGVTPMRTPQPGEKVEQLLAVVTLRQGEDGPETPLGERSIAIVLEDLDHGSLGIQVRESGKPNLTRHCCRRNTVFILNEGMVIGIPKNGLPGKADKYPESIKLLLVRLGYVQE